MSEIYIGRLNWSGADRGQFLASESLRRLGQEMLAIAYEDQPQAYPEGRPTLDPEIEYQALGDHIDDLLYPACESGDLGYEIARIPLLVEDETQVSRVTSCPRLEILPDPDPEEPELWATVIQRRGARYTAHSEAVFVDPEDYADHEALALAHELVIWFPLYMLVHSGQMIRVDQEFGDPWDSGCCGLVGLTAQQFADWWGSPWTGDDEQRTCVLEGLSGWAEVMNSYWAGDVWGYRLETEDEDEDSCWGFIGLKHVAGYLHDTLDEKYHHLIGKALDRARDL